jgi:hypothetical protein
MSHLRDDLLEEGAFVKVKDWLNADQAAQRVLPPTVNHGKNEKKRAGGLSYFLGQEPLLQCVPCLPKP